MGPVVQLILLVGLAECLLSTAHEIMGIILRSKNDLRCRMWEYGTRSGKIGSRSCFTQGKP